MPHNKSAKRGTLLLIVAAGLLFLASCARPPAIPTLASLAPEGGKIFAARCADCHGAQGEGKTAPAVMGAGANLAKYSNAGLLHKYVSTAMPWDSPGSLPQNEYLQLVSFLIVENKLANGQTAVDPAALDTLVFNK